MAKINDPNPSSKASRPVLGVIPLAILLFLTIGYRIWASHYSPSLGNTAPLMAVAFGGALLLGWRFWWVPAVLLIASDLFLGLWHGGGGIGIYTLFSAVFYTGVALLGGSLGRVRHRWATLLLGTLSCSVLFYVAANTCSWLFWGGYEKSIAGWIQAQTTGLPGIQPPAWMFLRNALLADSLWCGLAMLASGFGRLIQSRRPGPSPAAG